MSDTNGDSLTSSITLTYPGGKTEEVNEEQLRNAVDLGLIANATSIPLLNRVRGSTSPDRRRNINHACGYPDGQLTIKHYQDMYDRDPVAARVVEVFPRETWQVFPSIYEDEDPDTWTPFEESLKALVKRSRGERCYFGGEKGNPLFVKMREADEKCGIGSFSVILVGIDDGKDWNEEAEFREEGDNSPGDPDKLLYLKVYSESECEIKEFEKDKNSPRYGQPVMYSLDLSFSSNEGSREHTPVEESESVDVHWTRVIHISEGDVFGTPRMQQVYNNLYNLQKIAGADPETFWLAAYSGLVLKSPPAAGGRVKIDNQSIKDMLEKRNNSYDKDMILNGMEADTLHPSFEDPSSHIDKQLELITIRIDCPKRVFAGTEEGKLAGGQDSSKWHKKLIYRQDNVCTPKVVVPVIDRFILLKLLSPPGEDGYQCWWPDLEAQDDQAKATVAKLWTEAMKLYVDSGLDLLMSPLQFWTLIMGFDEKEAQSIIEEAEKYGEEKMEEEEEQVQRDIDATKQKIDAGVMVDPTAKGVNPNPAVKPPTVPQPAKV